MREVNAEDRSHLDYEVLIDANNHQDANEWCKEHFGKKWSPIDNRSGQWTLFWGGRDHSRKYRFCFAKKEDAAYFVLRWSSG